MSAIDKKTLSEIDICDLFISPSIKGAGWDPVSQIRREVTLAPGPVVVRGNVASRNKKRRKFADYVLYREPNVPIAVIEAKDNNHTVSQGLQQALGYAEILDVPSAFSSNGDAFASHNKVPFKGIERFLHCVVLSPYFQSFIWNEQTGAGRGGLPKNRMDRIPVALPPVAEQQRIVTKVDELMALCNKLELARDKREATRDKLTAASLARLNTPDPETFRDDSQFALDALPALTARPDQIKQLRQTILNLAVHGRLVPQDLNDKWAQEAIRSIRTERSELIRSGLIRRDTSLTPIRDDELPFDIPANWVWTRIGEAALFTQYGTSARALPSERGVPVLTMGNIQDGMIVCGNEKRIPDDSDELPDLFLKKLDLLYNRTNSAELVGKTGIYLGEDDCRTFASYLIRLRFSLNYSSPRYVNLAMNAPIFRETQIIPLIKKQTGQANVNGRALKNMVFPFPPPAEQHRIVVKVDELMELCDQLEASLGNGNVVRSRLLEAVLAKALESFTTPHLAEIQTAAA